MNTEVITEELTSNSLPSTRDNHIENLNFQEFKNIKFLLETNNELRMAHNALIPLEEFPALPVATKVKMIATSFSLHKMKTAIFLAATKPLSNGKTIKIKYLDATESTTVLLNQ